MAYEGGVDRNKAERFRLAALPYLDDVYTLARYLLRNNADAEDAAQECYLRAFRHFETFRRRADQAMAAGDIAQRLPRRICPSRHACRHGVGQS
jgi:Sigma-70 region 2